MTNEINKIKSGVSIRGIQPEMFIAYSIVADHFHQNGITCVITSATEGRHEKASLHYIGHAIDLRTRDLIQILKDEYKDETRILLTQNQDMPDKTNTESKHVADEMDKFVKEIKESLGDEFDVVLESTHLHIEFQPKGALNV